MNVLIFRQFAVLVGTIVALGTSTILAQVNVPFQITSGFGTVTQLPSATEPVQGHDITSGTAVFDGQSMNYTGNGTVSLLGLPDPITGQIPFQSNTAFLFDFGNGDTLQMHYGHPEFGAPSTGNVSVTPLPSGLVDITWLATFNPVPDSGTGVFANVVAGEFFMTASQDAIDPAGLNVPYRWSSDIGFLTLVPEPCTSASIMMGGFALLVVRRRRK